MESSIFKFRIWVLPIRGLVVIEGTADLDGVSGFFTDSARLPEKVRIAEVRPPI